jgi:hypothetical protein
MVVGRIEDGGARSLATRVYGADSIGVGTTLTNLATFYQDHGQLAEAAGTWQHVLRIAEKTYGDDHPNLAGPLNSLSEIYKKMGKVQESQQMADRAGKLTATR